MADDTTMNPQNTLWTASSSYYFTNGYVMSNEGKYTGL